MFIQPISFNSTNYKVQTSFGISKTGYRRAASEKITPEKVQETINYRTLSYATITVLHKKEGGDPWEIINIAGNNIGDAKISLARGEEQKIVSTQELCENYKDWCSIFKRKREASNQELQQPSSPKRSKPIFGTIMETLSPNKNADEKNLLSHIIAYCCLSDGYLVSARMKNGSTQQISGVCSVSTDDPTNPNNIGIVLRENGQQESVVPFDEFYAGCEKINFWNPNYN